jgi:hypothetical protein
MAKINQGIFGAVQGKIGNVVGSSYKGIPVLKTKAASVANPQTAGQVEQRTRMTSIVAFAREILASWIKPLWDRFAVKMSGYNLFVSDNVAQFAGGELTTPANLVMSVGNMAATAITSLVQNPPKTQVQVVWVADTEGFHLATDVAFALCYNETNGAITTSTGAARSAASIQVDVPEGTEVGDVLRFWLVFKRVNGLYISLASTLTHELA